MVLGINTHKYKISTNTSIFLFVITKNYFENKNIPKTSLFPLYPQLKVKHWPAFSSTPNTADFLWPRILTE